MKQEKHIGKKPKFLSYLFFQTSMKKYLKFIVKLRFGVNVNVGPIKTTTDETTTFRAGCNLL
jgi:hypothetical protein